MVKLLRLSEKFTNGCQTASEQIVEEELSRRVEESAPFDFDTIAEVIAASDKESVNAEKNRFYANDNQHEMTSLSYAMDAFREAYDKHGDSTAH